MQKRHLMIILSLLLIFVVLLSFSSMLFELKHVKVKFVNETGDEVDMRNNQVYTSSSKINEIISSTSFDYGKLLFLINKDSYISELERENPYIKILSVEAHFPDTLVLVARERKGLFYFKQENNYYIIDDDFKILDITTSNSSNIELKFVNKTGADKSFFDFFDLSICAYDKGLFINDNNLVFTSLDKFYDIVSSILGEDFFYNISSLTVIETESNANIRLLTSSPYGAIIEICDILENFDEKFIKVLNAFKTLNDFEKIKTTYGRLTIDKYQNVYWYNL